MKGGSHHLVFIPVPAPEYADDIIIKAYSGDGGQLALRSSSGTDYTADGFAYSVRTYAQNKSRNGSTQKMRDLAKALNDYGTAAQVYFRYGDFSGAAVDSAVKAVTLDDLAPYVLTTEGTRPGGVTGAGINVAFESDNTLRITFKTDGSRPLNEYTFLLDGKETKPKKSGRNAYLQVKNIAAPNLDTPHTFYCHGRNRYLYGDSLCAELCVHVGKERRQCKAGSRESSLSVQSGCQCIF